MAALTFEDIFKRLFTHSLNSSVYTSIPAEVVSVDTYAAEQTVDVKPLINKTYEDGVVLALPRILAVPVVFPSAGNGALTFPIQIGDTVLLTFSMRSMDEWLEGDGTSTTPVDLRTYYLNDAIAIPGLCTKKSHLSPNTTDIELKFLDEDKVQLSSIKMKPNGDLTIDTKNDLIATVGNNATIDATNDVTVIAGNDANVTATNDVNVTATNAIVTATGKIDLTAPTINLVGNVAMSGGTVTHNGTNIGDTHTHTGSPTAPTGAITPTGVPV